MKKYIIISILIFCLAFLYAQEKQKLLLEQYLGKWHGEITTTIINRNGGWENDRFLGYHEVTINEIIEKYSVNILHPFDSPEAIDNYKKMGYSDELIKISKALNPIPDRLEITGNIFVNEYSKYTHTTRSYCEECSGNDYTEERYVKDSIQNVSGYIDLTDNNWHWKYSDFSIIRPNCVIIDDYIFEEPLYHGGYTFERKILGELHKVRLLKDTLYKTVQINEPIITDQYIQREIIIPASPEFPYEIGELVVAGNTECVFTSKNELMLSSGEIIMFEDNNWWENIDLNNVLDNYNITENDLDLILGEIDTEKEQSFKVKTPQSVSSVRGTIFIIKIDKQNNTIIRVLEGEINCSDINFRKTVTIKKNQQSILKSGSDLSNPEYFDLNMIDHWWK